MTPSGTESLADLLDLLFPRPARVRYARGQLRRRPQDSDRYVALPSLAKARVLLPQDRAVAARALRHARRPRGPAARVATSVASALLRSGAGNLAPAQVVVQGGRGPGSLIGLLEDVLGAEVTVGMSLGPLRANRKPVLQVLDARGRLIAVAKIGVNELTRRLAGSEARALEALRCLDTDTLQVPRLLFHDSWRGLSVMVQSALPLLDTATPTSSTVTRSMLDLATASGVQRTRFGDAAYTTALRSGIASLGRPDLVSTALEATRAIAADPAPVGFSAWHGDWTHWNCAQGDGRLLVWDWERFETSVPLGFDALHWSFQDDLRSPARRAGAGAALLQRCQALLDPFGVDPTSATSVAMAYLLHIGTRYATDRQADVGIAGGAVEEWLAPGLERFLRGEPGRTRIPEHG